MGRRKDRTMNDALGEGGGGRTKRVRAAEEPRAC